MRGRGSSLLLISIGVVALLGGASVGLSKPNARPDPERLSAEQSFEIAPEYQFKDDPPFDRKGWLGFYFDGRTSILRRVRMELIAGESESSAKSIVVSKPDRERWGDALMVIRARPEFSVGPIETTTSILGDHEPGKGVAVGLNSGKKYQIQVSSKPIEDNRFALTIRSDGRTQALPYFISSNSDEEQSSIIWAGDLDRDGLLDLYLGKGSARGAESTLYLSSFAAGEAGELLGPAASHSVSDGGP